MAKSQSKDKINKDKSIEKQQNVILFISAIILILLSTYFIFRPPAEKYSSILGDLKFVNVKPENSIENVVKVVLYRRSLDLDYSIDFIPVDEAIIDYDNLEWKWESAINGKKYEFRADLFWDENYISSSNIITAIAPSAYNTLVFDISVDDIPNDLFENAINDVEVPDVR